MTEQPASASDRPGRAGLPAAERETRLAVVLNGGVSLAVWMGGVTHELNRLRLASVPGYSPANAAEARVHDAWRAILERAGCRAVVDTIAGTSAGGLNGTLLAAAVAGGKDLACMRGIWSDTASLELGKLLSRGGEPAHSVLDGKFFHEEIEKLIDGIARDAPIVDAQDCTLLVTATALNVDPTPVQLEGGAQASMVDSRRVFKFERRTLATGDVRHDPQRGAEDAVKDDFTTDRPSIARASRASASFPGAFEPVLETGRLRSFRTPHIPEPEAHPAPEAHRSQDTARKDWLIDGGVLDNAPFGPLLEALRARPVGAPFERVLLYITPSPGAGRVNDLGGHPTSIRVLKRVLAAFREPDQRLDFEGLRHAFAQMGYTLSTPHDAVLKLFRSDDPEALARRTRATVEAEEWFGTYQWSRAEAVERWLEALDGDVLLAAPQPPVLSPRDLRSVPTAPSYTAGDWQWGVATGVRVLRWWGRALVAYHDAAGAHRGPVGGALAQVQRSQRWVAQLQEQLEAASRTGAGSRSLRERAQLLNDLIDAEKDEVRDAVVAAAEAIAELPAIRGIDATTLIDFTLAIEVASTVLSWGSGSEGDEPTFRYRQITPAADPLVPLDPDVTNHPGWPARKLYGQRLHHFGAFLKREDREADWLWGRLDGASALAEYFLHGTTGADALKDDLARAVLAAEGSSPGALRQATDHAVSTDSLSLLRELEPGTLSDGARFLWGKAGAVVRHRLWGSEEDQDPEPVAEPPTPGSVAAGSV